MLRFSILYVCPDVYLEGRTWFLLKSVISIYYICLAVIFYIKGKVSLDSLQTQSRCCTKAYKLSQL